MGEGRTAKVCPYCEGKGYVSVVVDLPPDNDPRERLSRTTWVRKDCPLCDGKGRISGDDSTPPKLPPKGPSNFAPLAYCSQQGQLRAAPSALPISVVRLSEERGVLSGKCFRSKSAERQLRLKTQSVVGFRL